MDVEALSGCVIVTGMPGAGKSTVSTLAAQLLPRACRVKGDDVNEMILTGRVPFNGEPVRHRCPHSPGDRCAARERSSGLPPDQAMMERWSSW